MDSLSLKVNKLITIYQERAEKECCTKCFKSEKRITCSNCAKTIQLLNEYIDYLLSLN